MRINSVGALFVLTACTGAPSRERFPGPQGRTTDVQQAATEKAVLGGFDSLNNPLVGSGVSSASGGKSRSAEIKTEETLHGVLTLGEKEKPQEGLFLFIAVRRPEGGPPLAVKRDQSVSFPYDFTLSAADSMLGPGSAALQGEVVINAKLKQDSDPLSQRSGDYFGTVTTKVGDQNIKIELKRLE